MVPTGAQKVTYSIRVSDPEVEVIFDVAVSGSPEGEAADEAIRIGAEAMVSHLEAEYPTATVFASRQYEGFITGDSWPV